MYNAPYQGVANQLSQYGRFGDSQLVHMNPIEVQMLARMSPTGQLTRNPQTGQPEAFLPFLAPLLGSFLGKAALGSALGAPLAGALGSAAATTIATGDLEKGIMSGITGFGIGTALGNLPNLADVATPATETVTQGVTEAATSNLPEFLAPEVGEGFSAAMQPTADLAASAVPPVIPEMPVAGEGFGVSSGATGSVAGRGLEPTTPSFGEQLAQPFQQPGDFFKQLAQPGSFLPIYVGETGRMARDQELMGRGSMREYEKEQEAERQRGLGQVTGVYDAIRRAYPVGYAQGGKIERYFDGGYMEEQLQRAMAEGIMGGYGTMPDPKDVQLSLRGAEYAPPPASSYSALDVGGEGYLPGVAPEFQYFREPPPPAPAPPSAVDPGSMPGGGNLFGGPDNFDLNAFLSQYGRFSEPGMPQGPSPYQDFDFSAYQDLVGGGYQPEMAYNQTMQAPVAPPTYGGAPDSFNEPSYGSVYDLLQQYQPEYGMPVPTMSEEDVVYSTMPVRDREPMLPPASPPTDYMIPYDSPFLSEYYDSLSPGMATFADGGMTPEGMPMGQEQDQLLAMTVAAIRGEVENADEIISAFVQQYGPEAFMQLREQVLQEVVPGAQTDGMIEGQGGGQDDEVMGMIGTQRPVAVSPGEYIIPADAVSLAGGGYSGDGAKFFDSLVEDIRQKTMGTKEQIRPYRRGS